mmetsp:Transcript_8780/g.14601  ORF Transcript_8780/g.14601 Transcript_8780/m.14601 type:complete len:194 (+) Transcript_8780:98-679(+)
MFSMKVFLVLSCIAVAYSFGNSLLHRAVLARRNVAPLSMIASIDIFAKDMDLTPTLKERVDNKVGKVISKLGSDAITANVILKVVRNDPTEMHSHSSKKSSQIAEVTVGFRGGGSVHTSEGTDDMYASIDLLSHKLAKSLRRHHEKRVDSYKKKKGAAVMQQDEEEEIAMLLPLDDEQLLEDLDEKYRDMVDN